MKNATFKFVIIITLCLATNRAMVMRNNDLIDKMVSHFQGKASDVSIETMRNRQNTQEKGHMRDGQKPQKVLSLMQNVLCRNFPTIPCNLIVKDETLKKLIEKSIQQIKYKRIALDKTTQPSGARLALFPIVNSEDLSNFLQVSETGHYKAKHKQKKSVTKDNHSHERGQRKKNKKESKVIPVYNGRKKIRRFFPHKIKYKERPVKNFKGDFGEYSEEKLSMSVEQPDGNFPRKMTFEPQEPPVWRIDYMKHGVPSLNMFGYDTDRLKGKIMKTGPNVIVDENILEQASRKDVLHPDVYIKKNFVGQNNVGVNSEDIME